MALAHRRPVYRRQADRFLKRRRETDNPANSIAAAKRNRYFKCQSLILTVTLRTTTALIESSQASLKLRSPK